ncbi:hypothetical protein [Motiliproteus sp. MSK22-1]|uniref:hypothetical protein n=1 Tax=Motiliproteus sp. MSK22-1 TaxID=1897630 RepID=UPI0009775FEC|nr:hypothetical protein [Motiliproteus sp. MSK22-1]OMH36181.1 hypothetical protein BGP75_10235 [Motiliproteus sp. MSK22-1]
MNEFERNKVASINGVDVFVSSKFRSSQSKSISEVLNTQLKGFVNVKVCGMKYNKIYLEPYVCSNLENYEFVPGTYKYTSDNEKMFILKNKNSLRITDKAIYFGLDSIFGLSIHYLYFLCLTLSEKTLVHAAAFKIGGMNILIPAFGGIGKTFLVSKYSENKDVSIYGDDLVLLDKDVKIYPYHRPMCLYKYHYDKYLKSRLPDKLYYFYPSLLWRIVLRIRMELLDKFGWKIGNVENITHSKGYITTKVRSILSKNQIPTEGAALDKIIVIKRKKIPSVIINKIFREEEKKCSAKYVSSIVHHEWADYYRSILAYNAFTNRSTALQLKITEDLIENAFLNTEEIYEINIPIEATDLEIEQALEKVL